MNTRFAAHLVQELVNDTREIEVGFISRLTPRFISKVHKKPLFLLRDNWKLQGSDYDRKKKSVVYEKKAAAIVQTLQVNRKEDSLTLLTTKNVRNESGVHQEVTFQLSSGKVTSNRLLITNKKKTCSYQVLSTRNHSEPYRLKPLEDK